MQRIFWAPILGSLLVLAGNARADSWSQFRGSNANGVSDGKLKLPAEIGPDQNLLWKTPLPSGHSSPVVHGNRVYVTGVRDQKFFTFALDAQSGKIVWEVEAPHKGLEKVHQTAGSHVQATPVTDGERVIVLFGSAGLFCYDTSGKQQWHLPLGPFKNDFGTGSSPILVGDRIVLNQDHDTDSFLMVLDKHTGKVIWKTDRSEFPRNYATPVIWEVKGKKQIVVAATLRAIGYDFETGKEIWTVRGLARIVNMTPTVGPDGMLYLPTWSPGGDETDRIDAPPFTDAVREHDKNKNGSLEENEVPNGPLKQRFTQIDRDKDGHITRAEYEFMRRVFLDAQNVIMAIKPGGTGDITETHVQWKYKKSLPYVPSPICYQGHVYMVKDGGIFSCLDAKTGQLVKQERVYGASSYFSSPVLGDGKIYTISQRGDLTVLTARPDWEILCRAKFREDTYATPAIANGRIYLRTNGHLYCFGLQQAE